MKTISFILQKKAALGLINWNNLLNDKDPKTMLVLISETGCKEVLSPTEKQKFASIIELDNFAFEPMKQAMDLVFAEVYEDGDQSRIACLHELHALHAAQIRDHYRVKFNMEGAGSDLIQYFRNKLLMKETLGSKGVRIPRYTQFDPLAFITDSENYLQSIENLLDFPMFAKPIDGMSSINSAFIKDKEALHNWCFNASTNNNQIYEIDEFIDGSLFHCDSLIQNGEICYTLVGKYLHPNADTLNGKLLASIVVDSQTEDYKQLVTFTEDALSHFPQLPDGLTHMEVFKNLKGEFIFLEVAARPPGALVSKMYQKRTGGVDILPTHLRLNLGLNIDDTIEQLYDQSQWGPFAGWFQVIASSQGGTITGLSDPEFSGGEHETRWLFAKGDVLKPASSIADVIGSTLFWNTKHEEIEGDFERLDAQKLVITIPKIEPIAPLGYPVDHGTSFVTDLKKGLNDFIDSAILSVVEHAKEVVESCPSYFLPDNQSCWNNCNLTFFSNHSAANSSYIANNSVISNIQTTKLP